MGRPRKASNVLEGKGAFKKNPQRARKDVEGVGSIGDAPEYFDELEKELWSELLKKVPPGVVTGSDSILLETAARYWAKLRRTSSDDLTASQIAQIVNSCNSLCLSPQSRTKIAAPKEEKENPFAQL